MQIARGGACGAASPGPSFPWTGAGPCPFCYSSPAMELLDSRRLTGPNLLLDRPGAILEVALSPEEAETAVAAWAAQVRRMLDAVGWTGAEIAARRFPGGASLAITA